MTNLSDAPLKGKTIFITGASRGIGHAIAIAAAKQGANVAIAAKSTKAHPKLEGTIFTAAKDVEAAGGKALPLRMNIRDEAHVKDAIEKTVEAFGGIDIVVNNASAISLTKIDKTEMKKFDLMHQVNSRGTYMVSKYAVPHLRNSANPHILTLSPPLDMQAKWFAGNVAYSMAKFGMSMVVLGLAGELKDDNIAVNALWPRTTIATAAIKNILGGEALMMASRTPQIVADAAMAIFAKPAQELTGQFIIDDTFLYEQGERDFDQYRVDPTQALMPDFFVPENSIPPVSLKAQKT